MSFLLNPTNVRSILADSILNDRPEIIIQIIDRLLDYSNDPDTLIAINQTLSIPQYLSHLIYKIISTTDTRNKVFHESYYHENGFHKIVLLSGKNFKLRLHHFGAGAKIPMENIHDHRWPFVSSILSGELKMDIFQLSKYVEDNEKLYHFLYNSDKSTGSYSTTEKGIKYIRKIEERTYYPSQHYLMLPHELHRIKNAEGEESITLILTGKPISKECNLFAKRPILDEEKEQRKYSGLEMARMLEYILETIYPQKN